MDVNIDGRALELTGPQIYLFNSDKLTNSSPDKQTRGEILSTLSKFLKRKGEITGMTIEGIVYEALQNGLFPAITPRIVEDINSNTRTLYTISHEDICKKVRELMNGEPSTTPNEQSFYSTDYGKSTHKQILKICRMRFLSENDWIGTGNDKIRALTFDKDIVSRIGKTFEVVEEIRITEQGKPGQTTDDDNEDDLVWNDWYKHNKEDNNQEHNSETDDNFGTMGRKYDNTEDYGEKKEENSSSRDLSGPSQVDNHVKPSIAVATGVDSQLDESEFDKNIIQDNRSNSISGVILLLSDRQNNVVYVTIEPKDRPIVPMSRHR